MKDSWQYIVKLKGGTVYICNMILFKNEKKNAVSVNLGMTMLVWVYAGRRWKMETKYNLPYPKGMQMWGWNRRGRMGKILTFPFLISILFELLQWALLFYNVKERIKSPNEGTGEGMWEFVAEFFLHGKDVRAGLERMLPPRPFQNWAWGESGLSHGMRAPTFRSWLSLHKGKAAGIAVSPSWAGLNHRRTNEWLPNSQPWGLKVKDMAKPWSSHAWWRPQREWPVDFPTQ